MITHAMLQGVSFIVSFEHGRCYWDVTGDAGFRCDKTAMVRDKMKETSCINKKYTLHETIYDFAYIKFRTRIT
jgi:hypothetical protein